MNLLFSMTLAGSLVFLTYFVTKPAARRYLPATWRYWLLKIALLFYLLPYQYFKYKYRGIVKYFFPGQRINSKIDSPYSTAINRMFMIDSDGCLYFENHTLILVLFGIWVVSATIYLLYHLIKYVDCMNDLQQITKLPVTLPDTANEWCQSRKLAKTKVSLFASQHIAIPFTIGLLTPRIILPASMVGTEASEMIISHELAHVKNHDNLVKLLCLLSILLHWYNPLIYLLYWEICKVSEQVCDAAVIQGMTEQEIERYKLLIIELGQKEPNINTLLASSFNGKFKMIKERMIVMNKTTKFSKKTRIVASLLTAVLLLALSPISVLAYSPLPTYEYQNQQNNLSDATLYFPIDQDEAQEIYDPFIECGSEHNIFIDANNQSYTLFDSDQVGRVFCSHDWVVGKVYLHTKDDNGGCTTYCYNGSRCSLCGSYKTTDLISSFYYVKCPH